MIPKKNQAPPDVLVVGGGAAGMMAAGRAAERGAKVILVEKTHRLGNKLLLTGVAGATSPTRRASRNSSMPLGRMADFSIGHSPYFRTAI